MSTTESVTATREFIIVGQDAGTGFTLWDVAAAPTDPTQRATVLEEIGVDAMDALGSVHLEHATSARAAVDQLVNELRKQSGIGSYGLSPDSQLENYEGGDPQPEPAAEDEPFGTAEALGAALSSGYRVKASSVPGLPCFQVDGLPDWGHVETRDRVRAGISNSGLAWPKVNMLVQVTPVSEGAKGRSSGLDLAIACTALAAAGEIPAECLAGVTLVGELGLDGALRVPPGLTFVMEALAETGTTTVLVPSKAGGSGVDAVNGIRMIGAASLNEALAVLTGHWHHTTDCVHCGDTAAPHRPCYPTANCTDCPAPF
jgi:hypothetical protein